MRARLLITISIVASPLGCAENPEAPLAADTAKQSEQPLTAERAKAAIVQMVASSKSRFGTPADADAINKLPLEKEESGRYRLGAFTLNPNESRFNLSVIPRGPGKACAFFCEGKFTWRNARWEAEITKESSALGDWPARD
jgi:hypothetical protein